MIEDDMHKDLRGNPIYVGQEVVYGSGGRYHHFGIHTVLGFTPKMVRISSTGDRTKGYGNAAPGSLVALPYSNTPTVVAVLVPLPNGGLLGIRRANEPQAGKIALPGGYQMAGETWQEAGAREVLEETGFKLDPKFIELHSYCGTDTYGNNMVFGYTGEPLGGYEISVETRDGEALEVLTLVLGKPYDWAFPLHQEAAALFWWDAQ